MAASASPAFLLLTAPPHPRGAGNRGSGATATAGSCLGSRDRGRPPAALRGRRQSLLLLSLAAAPLAFGLAPAGAEDVPLFGLRKKLRKIEEGAEEIVREGEKAVEKGIVAAEKGIEAAEKGIEVAGKKIQLAGKKIQAGAENVPLFGLRKKLREIEEGAEDIVREGEKAAEKGIQVAGKKIQVAEKEIGAATVGAATGLEIGLGGDLVQAGAVAAAEVVGVLVAVSVVNGILGPEGRRS